MSEFLFREFSNHVYLGQWELARACAFTLLNHHDSNEKDKQSLLITLQSIIKNPNIVRSAWSSVSCPSLMGFLSCQLLLDIGCTIETKTLKRKSDFNILLETFLSNSHLALEELSSIHSRVLEYQNKDSSVKNADCRLRISPKTISAIKSAFAESPGALSKLLEMLFIPNNSNFETNIPSVIYEIHSQNLLNTLKSIKSKSLKSGNVQHLRDLRSKVYFLLSILPESFGNSEKKKHVDEIFSIILQLSKSQNLDVAKVNQALFCRPSPILLKNFNAFQKEETLKCDNIEAKTLYPKCFASDGTFSHQDALLSCIENSLHFVKDTMEFCIDSILDGKFTTFENVMQDSLFMRLKPLILLSSWSACKDDASAMNVIEVMKTWNEESPASVLSEACHKFKLNTALMELGINYFRSINPEAGPDEIISKKRNILFLLQTQSPLRVLHTIFGLKNIQPRKVMEMLQLIQGESSYPLDDNVHLTDRAIYSGYLSLVLVMEAIHFSCELKDICVAKKIKIADSFSQKLSNEEMDELDDIETPENKDAWFKLVEDLGPQRAYLKVVSNRIKKAEEEVRSILPVAFRVEILENIFSLLFCMSNVLPDSNEMAAESDQGCEGDANASLAKKESFSSQTPSSDNEKAFPNNFVISTVKLKDCDSGEPRYLNQFSSKSTESNSSCGMQPYAFLCNEFITKDILSLLSRIVIKAKLDVYETLGLTDRALKNKSSEAIKMDELLKSDSKLSICNAELAERTSRLLQHINEATWRYEVVTSGIFQGSNFASPLENRKYFYLVQSQCSASSSDTDREGKRRKKKKKLKRKLSNHKKELIAESSIIQCMLSSPEALLRYSLWNKNLSQAGDIIQLFNLNSSSEAKEVILIQELKRISQKLSEGEKLKVKSSSSVHTPDGKTLLSIIEDAATTGVQSSELCLAIHEELSSLKVPDLVDISGGIRHPELVQGSENIYSIFLTDLGCTSEASLALSATLLDMASKSWNTTPTTVQDLDAKILSKKRLPSIRGIQKTLTVISSVLKEFITVIEKENLDDDFRELFWPKCQGRGSFTQILCSYMGSLDVQKFTEELKNWQQTANLLKEFTILMREEEKNEQNGTSKKDTARENKIHMTYKNLSKVVRNLKDWSSEVIRPVQKNYDNYLSKLFNHLHQVTSAVSDCKRHSVSSDTAQTRIHTSDFSILKESPVDLLKNIILQSGVPPDKMEKFAIRMKVDLVHVLAQACLPYVPLLEKSVPCTKLMEFYQVNVNGHSMLILNKQKDEWVEPRHPDLVARELMKEMIEMINDSALAHNTMGVDTLEALVTLSEHSQLVRWMEDCSEIAFVDLDLLSSRREKLAFFVNVTNIAWLHAILLEVKSWKSLDQENDANFRCSTNSILNGKVHVQLLSPELLERLTMQKVVGYSIGQLGPVSLFDLRYQLLHAQLPVPKHLEKPPFDKLLDDPRPEWEIYTPPLEPKLLFVLVEGLQYSPKLQTMNSEIIDDELEEAMKDYFDFGIKIDLQKNKVSLPSLLEWYSDDFSKDDEQDLERAPYEGLVNLISTLVRSGLAEQFKDLFNRDSVHNFSENIDTSGKKLLPFVLEFRHPSVLCGIILQYSEPSALHRMNPPKVSTIIETESSILTYLKDKCIILNDLYEIFRSDHRIENFSKENLCLDDLSTNLFSFQEYHSNLPLTRLLAFYKNMLQHRDNREAWFSSALSPSPCRIFISHQLEACFAKSEWHKGLVYVDTYLEHFENDQTYMLLRQLILEHLVSLNLSVQMDSFSYALCIKNPVSRAKTILLNLFNWSDSCAIQALKYCLSDKELTNYPDVYQSVGHKLKEVILYKKIFDASEMFGDSEVKDCVFVFNNWQEIADCSIWDQCRILDFLKSSEKYDLAVQWSELHQINKDQKLLGLSMNIVWHLTQDPLHEKEVQEIIDSFDDISECIKLCDMVLPDLPTVESKLCLVQHLVTKTSSHDKHYHYYNMALGLKMLCALSSSIKESYIDIISQPYLILEQMLMNVELRDAEKALKAIYEDLKSQTDVAPVMSPSSVNQLVEDYASKALELHFLDSLLDDSSSSTIVVSTEEVLACEEPYIMPPRVPTKDEWVPDAKIHCCQVCKEERFNMFSRRHHCRRCGRVVCANCSQHALIVEGYGSVKVRVCDDCYNLMTGSVSLSTASFEKRYRLLSSMRSSSPRNSPFQGENSMFRRRTSSIHSSQQAFRWVLSCDSEQNANVRNEFSYEKTPSITLCYSILKLHTDDKKCALFLMNMCDRFLGKIKMKRSGKGAADIDYSMVISMMKSLILNAKVKSHQVEDSEGERLADLYFQHLDVIELLVSANCRHLIPKGLTNPDTVRRLRDTLWQEERMNLAMEISTKFSLEKNGIWSSWGVFCLMGGDWPTARTKFQQCMKVVSDKSDNPQENPSLAKILKILEEFKYPSSEKAAAISRSLSSLRLIQQGLTQFESEVSPLNELVKRECLYYLNLYGTHNDTVEFFQRHGLLNDALNYIKNKNCDTTIFIEALFMPSLKNALLAPLKRCIYSSDPNLNVWSTYLFATCKHLDRLKYFNVLYEIQVFMEDYARAATSAIKFYIAPAPNYKTLFERERHLYNAKKHYDTFLAKSKDSTDSWRKRKNILVKNRNELESGIKLISLQEQVSSFLKVCESQIKGGLFYEMDAMKNVNSNCPPTLLGRSQEKNELICMLFINALHVDDGYDLIIKIIKYDNLDGTSILSKVGKELVRLRQLKQIPHFLATVKCMFSNVVKVDDVILESVSAINQQGGDVEEIIRMLISDSNKINAYLMCGKLKSAYLLAIKQNSALDVRRVMVAAEQCDQESIQRICKKWLDTYALKLKPKDPVSFK